jgi:hypothetical protein
LGHLSRLEAHRFVIGAVLFFGAISSRPLGATPSIGSYSKSFRANLSIHQRFEHRVSRIAIELNPDLGPHVIGKIIELPARGHGQQQRLGLLLDRKFGNLDGIGKPID